MHNLDVEALEATAANARDDPGAVRREVAFEGEWQVAEGAPQFRATIPFPKGEVVFEADFPPPMGGTARPRTRSPTASGAGSPATR